MNLRSLVATLLLALLAGCSNAAPPTAYVSVDSGVSGEMESWFPDADELPEGLELVVDDDEGDGYLDDYAMHTNPGLANEDRFDAGDGVPDTVVGAMYWGTRNFEHRLDIWVLSFASERNAERFLQTGDHCVPYAARTLLDGATVVQVELDHNNWGSPIEIIRSQAYDDGYDDYGYSHHERFMDEGFYHESYPEGMGMPFPVPRPLTDGPFPVRLDAHHMMESWTDEVTTEPMDGSWHETDIDHDVYLEEPTVVPGMDVHDNVTGDGLPEFMPEPAAHSATLGGVPYGLPDWVEPVADLLLARSGAEDVCLRPEFQPDDNENPLDAPMISTEWTVGAIERRGDQDYYRIDVVERHLLRIEMAARPWTPSVELTDVWGGWMGLDYADSRSGGDWSQEAWTTVVEPGIYYLRVHGYDPIPSYQVRASVSEPPVPDGNDDWSYANAISDGESGPFDLGTRGDRDWYTFDVTRAGPVFIELQAYDEEPDTEMRLYDADLMEIAYNDDGNESLLSQISQRLPRGTYFIEVAELGGEPAGRYYVHLDLP